MACLFTATLFFAEKGDVLIGMLFFILAEIGYRSAQVFYNALLPEIAAPEEIGRVSGNGWAIGSAGGILCLLLILPLIILIKGTLIVRLSLVITAVFFALSAVPIFIWLRERAQPQSLPLGAAFLAVRTGARILPMGFDGLLDVFPRLRRGRRARVTVRIGKPFGPFHATGRGRVRRQQLEAIGHEIMRRIAELIPPERRGHYSDDPAIRAAAQGSEIYPWADAPEG